MDKTHYNQQKLVDWREEQNKTQDEIAEIIGVVRETVNRAEMGKVASYELLCNLCRVYGKSIHELTYESPLALAV